MTQRYFNHFAAINLVYPADQREHYERFCQTGARSSVDRSPFPRMVDFLVCRSFNCCREKNEAERSLKSRPV